MSEVGHIITSEPINQYAEQYSSEEMAVLKSLRQDTIENVHGSQMISGHLQGLFLQMISHMTRPFSILEIGTYTGYSAICLAQGLRENGKLYTIDIDNKLQDLRDKYWHKAGLSQQIVQHIGDAVEIIPQIEGSFDLVFIDADKKNYNLYFDLVIDRINKNGYMLADNTLFNGETILPEEHQSKSAKSISLFNQKLKSDERIAQVLLPIRDGLTLARKIS